MTDEIKIVTVRVFTEEVLPGEFKKIYRVYFKLPNGETDWIDVPPEEYISGAYKDKIKEIIEATKKALGQS